MAMEKERGGGVWVMDFRSWRVGWSEKTIRVVRICRCMPGFPKISSYFLLSAYIVIVSAFLLWIIFDFFGCKAGGSDLRVQFKD
ncbi:unnamed protein product [Malus baccata var. baccata]